MFRIFIKKNDQLTDTQIVVDTDSEADALRIFKAQVAYRPGVSKNDYVAKKI